MATPGPGPVFAIQNNGHIFVKIWNENHQLTYDAAEKLANDIYDALGIEHVTRSVKIPPEPSLTTNQVLDDWFGDRAELEAALKFDNRSLFNDKAINDALSSTISRYDQLTNTALILANNVAAVMKLHGFSFDQAMMIVGVAKGETEPATKAWAWPAKTGWHKVKWTPKDAPSIILVKFVGAEFFSWAWDIGDDPEAVRKETVRENCSTFEECERPADR